MDFDIFTHAKDKIVFKKFYPLDKQELTASAKINFPFHEDGFSHNVVHVSVTKTI